MSSLWLTVLCLLSIDLLVNCLQSPTSSPQGVAHEYCDGEVFRPRCYQQDEVVVVTQADYGLMAHGRCLTVDYGTVGCFADVISHVAGVCSGRKSCDLRITDPVLDNMTSPCQRDFRFFLNATFTCVKVERRSCSTCETIGQARVTSAERGLLASIVTAETNSDIGCGSARCPWLIDVRPGQVINLTLFDYGPSAVDKSRPATSLSYPSSETQCTGARYLLIKERANPRETVVCGASVERGQRHIYTSISNQLEIHVISQDVTSWKTQFIVEYDAVGCADVVPPRHTWMKRVDNIVEVGCPTTGSRWTVTCIDGKWQGEMGKTCPGVPGVSIPGDMSQTVPTASPSTSFLSDFPMNVLLAAVVAVASVIGVFILTIGIVCIKRHQYKKRHPASRPNSIYARATSEFEFHGDLRAGGPGGPPETTPMIVSTGRGRPPTATKPRLSMARQYPDGAMYDPELQQQQAGRRMIGSRPLPSIPGGSVERQGPPHPLQTTVQLHPTTGSMQSACTCHSHPRGAYPAGQYPYPYPYPGSGPQYPGGPQYPVPSLAPKVRSIGTGPTAGGWDTNTGSRNSALYGNATLPYTDDQHHYFVLDPEVVQDRPPSPPPSPPPSTTCYQVGSVATSPYHVGNTGARPYQVDVSSASPYDVCPPTAACPVSETPSLPSSLQRATPGVVVNNDNGLRFPTPPPPLPEAQLTNKSTVVARRQSPDGKEKDEARDLPVDDELNKNRCSVHEIPLRPTRDGQNSQGKAVTGTEPVDIGAGSWP